MLIPTKHQNLQKNLLVLGADVISLLKSEAMDVDSVFQELKKHKAITLDEVCDTLVFLWLSRLVVLDRYRVSLNRIHQ